MLDLEDVWDVFLFFSFGGVQGTRRGEGVGLLLKIPGGGVFQEEGGGEWPGGCLRGNSIWGGGAKYFLRGRNSHQVAHKQHSSAAREEEREKKDK